MQKIYIYKLTVDAGAAPCVHRGVLSLAICKPTIRKVATKGDLIFGFTANSLDKRNRLIYAARITEKLSSGDYYRKRKYASRDDCIYRYQSARFIRRKNANYHDRPQDLVHDLGHHPNYDRSDVLLSSDFRYFGSVGTNGYKTSFPLIRRAVEHLGRGHLVNLTGNLKTELLEFEQQLWHTTSRKIVGRPTSLAKRGACYRGGNWEEVC